MHIAAEFATTAPAAFAWLVVHASDAGSALITSVWQGAVIVCILEIATRLMPRISAAHRFALWGAGFLLSASLSLLPLIRSGGDPSPVIASSSALGTASTHPVLQLDARWGIAIAILWLAASLVRAAALTVHTIRLRRLWKAARPVQTTASLSTELNYLRNGCIAICTTQLLDRPSVIGFLSPRILVPEWLLSRLTPGELDQIILHEAQHLRRADDWTNLIQKLCLLLFPLNPALAWIERRLCREREMACDEGVVRLTNAPRAYAACLANLAERRLERRAEALSLGAWHRRSELVHRVHRILLHKRTMSRTVACTLVTGLGSMLLVGSVEMSRIPQLVAFVPKHNTQAVTPARQIQLDALLARENTEANSHLPQTYRAVPARAILPDQPYASAHTRKHPTTRTTPQSRPSSNATPVGAEQIAKSDLLGDRVIPTNSQPQQWVVVTEWHEVTSTSRIPQTISDFDPESEAVQSAPSAINSQKAPTHSLNTPDALAPPTHRFTVTQLILRVVPANPNSTSSQPPTATVRDGWFVIQL